eukprot:6212420-Pleurochrysis_carterae.AAC.5
MTELESHMKHLQSTLKAVQQTRKDEAAQRLKEPSYQLASLMAAHAARKAVEPPPQPRTQPARTEAQRLLDSLPKTSSRQIGHYEIPKLPPPTPKAFVPNTELDKARSHRPRLESEELGYHPTCRKAREAEVSDAKDTMRRVNKQDLKKDPELAAAVAALQERVAKLDNRRVRPTQDNRLCHGEDK